MHMKGRNEKYVALVEASLDRALSNQINHPKPNIENSIQHQDFGMVPPHFYRELTRTSEGCKLLKESGHFGEFIATVKNFWFDNGDPETILKVKGCLWAIGNIGSMELGAPFIDESDIVHCIIRIAEQSQIITMRGTAFFVLGLISRSLHGMEMLAEHGWDAATDQFGRSLGYCLPPVLESLFIVGALQVQWHILIVTNKWRQISPQLQRDEQFIPHISSEVEEYRRDDKDPIKAHILSLITDLGNTVLTKRAAAELHGHVPSSIIIKLLLTSLIASG